MAIEEVVAIPADSAVLEYSTDDVTYYELQDVSDITTSQGGLNEVETETFEDGSGKVPGAEAVQNLTIAIPNFLPHLAGWVEIEAAIASKQLLYWRLTTDQELMYRGTSVSINAQGEITFNDVPPLHGVGMVIKVGGNNYVIDTATETETLTRSTVAAAVNLQPYELVVPSLRLELQGWVKSLKNYSLLPAQSLASALEIMLNSPLPTWEIV